MHEQLEALLSSVETQTCTVEKFYESRTPDMLSRRPAPEKWSVVEHLEHLAITNALYLESISGAVERAKELGWAAEGPFVGGRWLAERLVASQEPPPRMRLRTFRKIRPRRDLDGSAVLERFRSLQRDFEVLLHGAEGVDLGRAQLRSPLLALVKLTAMQGFRLIECHNRRHIWHMEQTLSLLEGGVS